MSLQLSSLSSDVNELNDELTDTYSIITAVRIRPLSDDEVCSSSNIVASTPTPGEVVILDPVYFTYSRQTEKERKSCERKFNFNFSYSSDESGQTGLLSSQKDIYDSIGKPMLNYIMKGQNCTLFAYGQTGSGKTYTMMGGEPGCSDEGLTPRLCRDILLEVNNRKGAQDVTSGGVITEIKIQLSFFEIYNERVHDLLKEHPEEPCRVREHPDRGAFVEGLTHREVVTFDDVAVSIKEGLQRRQTAETLMNAQSSRSHAVLSVSVAQEVVLSFGEELEKGDTPHDKTRPKDPTPPSPKGFHTLQATRMRRGSSKVLDCNGRRSIVRVGKVCLVDLAGSERLYSTGATGQRRKEGTYINLSLSTLGDVIKALSERSSSSADAKFVPYRNSVLTYVLKDSIGGNSRTSIIATISPTVGSFSESVNTLRFITKAKLIVNRVSVNERSEDNKYIQNLHRQIALYKAKLASTISEMQQKETSYEMQIQSLKKQLTAANEVIASAASRRIRRENDMNSVASMDSNQSEDIVGSTEHGGASVDVMGGILSRSRIGKSASRCAEKLSTAPTEAADTTESGSLERSQQKGRVIIHSTDTKNVKDDTAGEGELNRLHHTKKPVRTDGAQRCQEAISALVCDEKAMSSLTETVIGKEFEQDRLGSVPRCAFMSPRVSMRVNSDSECDSDRESISSDLNVSLHTIFSKDTPEELDGLDTPSGLSTKPPPPSWHSLNHSPGGVEGYGRMTAFTSPQQSTNSSDDHSTSDRDGAMIRFPSAQVFDSSFDSCRDVEDSSDLVQDLKSSRKEIESLRMSLFSTQEENKFLEYQLSIVDRDLQWLLMPSE